MSASRPAGGHAHVTLTGVVLAGATSRLADAQQVPAHLLGRFVGRVAMRLAEVCTEVLVVAPEGGVPGSPGRLISPADAGSGPLAAILGALEAAKTPLCAVVAADVRSPSPAVLRLLADRWQGEAAVVPLVDDRVEPLHGVYATDAAVRFRRLLYEGKRGVTHVLSELGALVVGEEEWRAADPGADLRRAR